MQICVRHRKVMLALRIRKFTRSILKELISGQVEFAHSQKKARF
jgi:hypothetical protein